AGFLGDVPAREGSYRQDGTEIGAVSAEQARGERLYRQRPNRSSAEAGGRHLERGAVAKACRRADQVADLARREAGHDLGAGVRRRGSYRLEQNRQGAHAESPRRGDPGRANFTITLLYL